MQIAQTNIQLYNQLLKSDLPVDDLVVVHRAYEFLTTLYPGCYQGDGKPFVSHGVGVASILAQLGQPVDILAVGLLHNIYGNADFGDGHTDAVTAARRRLVGQAVGARIDELLVRFRDLRIQPHTIEDARSALPQRDETERRLIIVDIADFLEKYVDLGVLYLGDSTWMIGAQERIGHELIEIAVELGEPSLAAMLSAAFADAAESAGRVPTELRTSDGRAHLKLVVPRSCQRRTSLTIRVWARRLRVACGIRTRVRRVRSALVGRTASSANG